MLTAYKILKDNVDTLEDWRAAVVKIEEMYKYLIEFELPPVAPGDCSGLPG